MLADYTPDFVAIGEESFKGYTLLHPRQKPYTHMAAIKPQMDNTFLFESKYHNDPAHASQQCGNHVQKFLLLWDKIILSRRRYDNTERKDYFH